MTMLKIFEKIRNVVQGWSCQLDALVRRLRPTDADITLKKIKRLPQRNWDKVVKYDSLLIAPSGDKHESDYALIQIVGVVKQKPTEIAAYCDDICWKLPDKPSGYEFRTDMYYPDGIIHVWSREYEFKVGCSLSSTDIELVRRAQSA
jgi:hypothetical protein